MKGENIFTKEEIEQLKELISQRVKASEKKDKSKQKTIRDKMRKIGFYGQDDFGVTDMTLEKFQQLIDNKTIQIITPKNSEIISKKHIKITNKRIDSDESYVIDLCDEILGEKALRQHRFPFLLGDPNKNGKQAYLPVDAYYEGKKIVIEYYERQHTEDVPFFDKQKKMTVSGVNRKEQRRIYDERRKEVLPQHGIKHISINYSEFKYDNHKRIIRDHQNDVEIVRKLLYLYCNLQD